LPRVLGKEERVVVVEGLEELADQEEQVGQVEGPAVVQESQDNLRPQSTILSNLYCTNHQIHRWGNRHKSLRRPNYSNNI